MKAKILIVGLTLAGITACKKDVYETTPQLTFKSVNASSFVQNDIVSFQLQVTDKEGDIQDSIWIQKVSLLDVCATAGFIDSVSMPQFTPSKDIKATVNINFTYGSLNGTYPELSGCTEHDDSCYFKFWLKDNAGHASDTVISPTIMLLN